jgi:hypothetical protein
VAVFEVRRDSALSASCAWARLTDWRRHGDFIPFTQVAVVETPDATASSPGTGGGAVFVARTGIGPLHFDDPMEVTYWRPPGDDPGVCRLVKTGRVVQGWAVLTVTPMAGGCSVSWTEDAAVRYTGPLLGWPTKVAAGFVFGRLVDKLLESPAREPDTVAPESP